MWAFPRLVGAGLSALAAFAFMFPLLTTHSAFGVNNDTKAGSDNASIPNAGLCGRIGEGSNAVRWLPDHAA